MHPMIPAYPMLSALNSEDLGLLLLRLTLIAVLGHAALALQGRAVAAKRHLTAVAALMAVAALPLASLLLPTWPLPLLPAKEIHLGARPVERSLTGRDEIVVTPRRSSVEPTERRGAPPAARLGAAARSGFAPGWSAAASIAMTAGLVAALLLLRLASSLIAAARAARRAGAVTDERLLRELALARARLGVRRAIALRSGPGIAVPMVVGVMRPALLLPANALGWTRERLGAVFLHEVAHVRRGDVLGQILVSAATSLCWFHPLVWTLARVARRECERACDDIVLGSGVRPSDYAEHLLAIACSASGERFVACPGFSKRSTVEGRLLFILRPGVRRGPASRHAAALALAGALLCLLPLASVRVTAAPVRLVTEAAAVVRDVPSRSLAAEQPCKRSGARTR